jgi:O-methyltransferase
VNRRSAARQAPRYASTAIRHYGRLILGLVRLAGLGILLPILRRRTFRTGKYTAVFPTASYAPWLMDQEFTQVWERVRKRTLVDVYCAYELWQLVRETGHLEGDIIEVGVWRGGSGAVIARSAEVAGSGSRVFLCDTFEGVVKASQADSYYRGGEHGDTSRGTVERSLSELGLENAVVVQGVVPDDLPPELSANRFRLCHIDVDVYESARDVLEWVWPRIPLGGIAVFDDFAFANVDGITRLVEEFRGRPDGLVVHNLNGHALIIRTAS